MTGLIAVRVKTEKHSHHTLIDAIRHTTAMVEFASNVPVCSLCLMSRRDSMMGRRIVKNNLNN